MNRSRKGTRVERLAVAILEAEGYRVHRAIRNVATAGRRFVSHSNDIFGCIDIIAKKRGQRTRWIQVTSGTNIGRKKQDLDPIPWDSDHDSVEIWRYVGGEGKRIDARTGLPRPRFYFQIYNRDDDYILDQKKRSYTQEKDNELEGGGAP